MKERIRPTRAGLFTIELLICVGVFALCAAVCIGLFVRAEVESRESADLVRAVNEARNVAECFKAAGGDLEETAALCAAGRTEDGALFQPYDGDWNRLSGANPVSDTVEVPAFYLTLEARREAAGHTAGALSVFRNGAAEPLLSWDVAALEAAA